jgi:outer membrane protein assembly factor BamD (BamD/ComL family)
MTYEELKEQVERELGMLQTDAYTKSIVRKALDEAEASRDLEAAQRLPQRDMRLALDEVIREYPNTEAATKAQAIVDSLWGDPRMRKFIVREREKEKAMRWYEIGERYAEAELFDLAREQLRKVISEFPGSAAAEKAQERLATLDEDKEKAERREAARAALQRRISSDRDGDG